MIAQPEGKTCSRCHEFKPLDHFRRRWKDRPLRQSECRACHAQLNADLRRRKRWRLLGGYLRQLASAEESEAVRVCAEMAARMGGVRSVADFWVTQMLITAALRPGSWHVLSYLKAMVKLLMASSRAVPPAPDLSKLSDEQLGQLARFLARRSLGAGGEQNASPGPLTC